MKLGYQLALHNNPPAPFNPDFRPGFAEAHSKAHAEWCEANPDVSREERAAAYRESAERLRGQYPTVAELNG